MQAYAGAYIRTGNLTEQFLCYRFRGLIYVVVQIYPWLKFSFLLFLGMVMYDNNMIMSLKQKKKKMNQG